MIGTSHYLNDQGPGTGRRTAPRSRVNSDAPSLDLNGQWKFRLLTGAPGTPGASDVLPRGEGVDDFARDHYDDSDWDLIAVPAHWVLQGDGKYGHPIYSNVAYPFPLDAPRVPDENPTGDYRRSFALPADFERASAVLLRFDGVESRYKVWINGVEIGVGSGSRLAQEFDITEALRPGVNRLAVRVHQWSAASYLEDQDQWWLPGIFREVTLLSRPVGALDDVWLDAAYDAETGEGSIVPSFSASPSAFPLRLSVPDLGIDLTWRSAAEITSLSVGVVEPWSAEVPRLYAATVAATGETVELRLGFRSVQIVGDRLTVNGKRVVFHGMNRHETHPDRGRVFDETDARADLLLMKQFNVNAIRTSHYPPHPRVLELADELGFWVILECDLETHGFSQYGWQGNPSDDPAWEDSYIDRIRRTVERDKNHPSIVMWSLGNESGTGSNLAAMSAWVHDRDPSRPVHYEGDYTGEYTDVYSRMYPSFAETASIGGGSTDQVLPDCDAAQSARQRSKPYLHCEYAHAMGNGPGGLAAYEELVDRFPRLHGGFVWEWRDHGLRATAPDGSSYFAYGGDFGERVHDGNFVMDGMVLSDGTPTPGLHEFKAVAAPIRLGMERDAMTGAVVLSITNKQHTADTSSYRYLWRIENDGVSVHSGETAIPVLQPGASATVTLTGVEVSVASSAESWLTLDAVLREDASWAPTGHLIATTQLDLTRTPFLRSVQRRDHIVVPDGSTDLASRAVTIGPAVFIGAELVELGGRTAGDLRLSIWRAPTDNDRVNLAAWLQAGLDRLEQRIEAVTASPGRLRIRSRYGAANSPAAFWTECAWKEVAPSTVRVRIDIVPSPGWAVAIPRIGVRLTLPREVDQVSWFGNGPGESYSDSLQAARVGLFDSGIDELAVEYARPQETGHRSGLRHLDLSVAGRQWLSVIAVPDERARRPGFTLSRHTAEDLTAAAHPYELVPSQNTYLYLDAAQHGLGSAACGPDVAPEFVLRAERRSLEFTFTVVPAAP